MKTVREYPRGLFLEENRLFDRILDQTTTARKPVNWTMWQLMNGHSNPGFDGSVHKSSVPVLAANVKEKKKVEVSTANNVTSKTSPPGLIKYISMNVKRPEEWNELYNRFMVFSQEWRLSSTLDVIESIMDSSLDLPYLVNIPASYFPANDTPLVQTLELHFENQLRYDNFEKKWMRFRKKFASYDITMSFTLAMDLIFGVIPEHLLVLDVNRGLGLAEKMQDRQVECGINQSPDLGKLQNHFPNALEQSLKVSPNACDSNGHRAFGSEANEVLDLTTSSASSDQLQFNLDLAKPHESSSPCSSTTTPSEHISFAQAEDLQSCCSSSPVIEESASNRRKSLPRKRVASEHQNADGMMAANPTPINEVNCGSELTDSENHATYYTSSSTGWKLSSTVGTTRPGLDEEVDFIVKNLQVVHHLARTVESHRERNLCMDQLNIYSVCCKGKLVEFYLVCAKKHVYQLNVQYDVVEGNYYVYA